MSYFNDRIKAMTRGHAFVPHSASPINNQPQYTLDAIQDGPFIAGGPLGAYFSGEPNAVRQTNALYRQPFVEGLGLSLPSGLDAGAIVGQIQPVIDNALSQYMPRIEQSVTSAVKSGINQGVNAAWPTIERKANDMLAPYKKLSVAFGLVSVATFAGVMVLLNKAGKK